MGAWGFGVFENDDALDWVIVLENDKSGSVVIEALDAVIHSRGDILEASDCWVGLAAAEVVAALIGNPGHALPHKIDQWLSRYAFIEEGIVTKASKVVTLILTNSELKDLWKETNEFEEWKSTVVDLLTRLS